MSDILNIDSRGYGIPPSPTMDHSGNPNQAHLVEMGVPLADATFNSLKLEQQQGYLRIMHRGNTALVGARVERPE